MISSTHGSFRRVLIISYAFPPVGGAGVQRTLKFTKYLPHFGWMPTVLTVSNPSVPVVDPKMLEEVPECVEVIRARTLEPTYALKSVVSSRTGSVTAKGPWHWIKRQLRTSVASWLQPDPQILWNPQAYRAGKRVLGLVPHEAIMVSGPPFSSFLLGARLKRITSLPLVLDFRDEWMLASKYLENHSRTDSTWKEQCRFFEETLLAADAIIATTKASAQELQRSVERLGSDAIVRTIYNGFDPDDFLSPIQNLPNKANAQSFHLVYTGTLWRLTNVQPLLQALRRLEEMVPDISATLRITFCGRRTEEQDQMLTAFQTQSRIPCERISYLPHDQSLVLAGSASALCLLLADEPGAERVVPGKLFEYFALRKPILAIVPRGETSQLIEEHHASLSFLPNDSEGIAHAIMHMMAAEKHASSVPRKTENSNSLDWCSRPALTNQLAKLLEDCSSSRAEESSKVVPLHLSISPFPSPSSFVHRP